ncbi:MAG: hypothetical protein QM817_40925 [Archangium sp.]
MSSLTDLNREWLHVFVAGPGKGEGIAVALPNEGWLFIDGCATSDGKPLRRLYDRFATVSEPVVGVIWTHPHQDHADGVAELIAELSPGFVGIAGADADSVVEAWLRGARLRGDRRATSTALKENVVGRAMKSIEYLLGEDPNGLIRLHSGIALPMPSGITATVRGPERKELLAYLVSLRLTGDFDDVNDFSTVVELEFEKTRIVLGADLPRFSNGAVVATGWERVVHEAPQLGTHSGLKLPHHGSREAFHPDLHFSPVGRGPWWLTPFNSADLPRLDESTGLPRLLREQSPISLTALPASREEQSAVEQPGVVRLDQIRRRRGAQSGVPFIDGSLVVTPPATMGALDPVWCCAFDSEDAVRGRWRGSVAIDVVPARAKPKKRTKR